MGVLSSADSLTSAVFRQTYTSPATRVRITLQCPCECGAMAHAAGVCRLRAISHQQSPFPQPPPMSRGCRFPWCCLGDGGCWAEVRGQAAELRAEGAGGLRAEPQVRFPAGQQGRLEPVRRPHGLGCAGHCAGRQQFWRARCMPSACTCTSSQHPELPSAEKTALGADFPSVPRVSRALPCGSDGPGVPSAAACCAAATSPRRRQRLPFPHCNAHCI